MSDLEQIKAIREALPHNAYRLAGKPPREYMWKRLVTSEQIQLGEQVDKSSEEITA